MLERLRFDSVIGGDSQQCKINPARTGQHRMHETLVARHVDEAENLPLRNWQIREAEIDGDPARFFFFQAVTIDPGQGFDQSGLPMIDVAGGTDDHNAICRPSDGAARVRILANSDPSSMPFKPMH